MKHPIQEDILEAAKHLYMKKAQDVVTLRVSHMTIVADHFILASGRSDVHTRALCDDIQDYFEKCGRQRLRIEGYREGRWIVLDYGDLLVHLFHAQEREFYGLERLWTDDGNMIKISDEHIKKD